jgi:hypothetical protein
VRVSWSGHPQLIKKRVNSSQKGGGHGCYILVTSSYTWWWVVRSLLKKRCSSIGAGVGLSEFVVFAGNEPGSSRNIRFIVVVIE